MLGPSALLAALLFTAFHVPVPRRQAGRWTSTPLTGKVTRLLGIGYHVLLLPVVWALAAPPWAVLAGLAWMMVDIIMNGAVFVGSTAEMGPFRDGLHLLSAVWLVAAGWHNGPVLAILGTALAAVFVLRFLLAGQQRTNARWVLPLNAALNALWWVAVAVRLW